MMCKNTRNFYLFHTVSAYNFCFPYCTCLKMQQATVSLLQILYKVTTHTIYKHTVLQMMTSTKNDLILNLFGILVELRPNNGSNEILKKLTCLKNNYSGKGSNPSIKGT